MRRLFLLFTLCLALLAAPVSAQEPSSFNYLDPLNVEPVARIGWGIPYAAAYMPDGQSIVVATSTGVSVYSLQLSELLHIPTWDHAPRELAVSPDGRLIATGGDDVHLWDAEAGALIDVMETESGVAGLAFSADGTRLAATKGWDARGYSAGIYIFDVNSGRQIAHLASNAIFAEIAFHPDGQRLIAQRVYDCCGSIAVIGIEDGANAPGFNPEAHGFTVMPDGEQILSYMMGVGWVRHDIDALDADPVEPEDRYSTSAYVAAASPVTADGTFGALTEDGEFALWDAETLSRREILPLGFKTRVAAISPDGRRIFAVDNAGSRVVLADIEDGITDEQSYMPAPQAPMILRGEHLFYSTADHLIGWLDAGTSEMRTLSAAHTARINALAAHHEFSLLYSASDDGTIRKWDPYSRDSRPEILFEQDGAQIKSLRYSAPSELYAVVCEAGIGSHLLRLNADTGESLGFFTGGQNSTPIPSVDVGCEITLGTVGGGYITYADRADLYHLNINSVDTVEREPLPVFFPDGLHADTSGEIVLIDGGGAVVWKRNSGLEVVASHTHDITALTSMNQGTLYIFAACARVGYYGDGEHFCSGAEMAMKDWQRPAHQIRGRSSPVHQIVVNQAETLFASVSEDGTIIVWGAWLEPKPMIHFGTIRRAG